MGQLSNQGIELTMEEVLYLEAILGEIKGTNCLPITMTDGHNNCQDLLDKLEEIK